MDGSGGGGMTCGCGNGEGDGCGGIIVEFLNEAHVEAGGVE